MPICLCVICGRFCAALTDSRSCCRDDVARNDRDIYSMALYRKKKMATPCSKAILAPFGKAPVLAGFALWFLLS